jgi:hypothetical protein
MVECLKTEAPTGRGILLKTPARPGIDDVFPAIDSES